MTITFIPKGSDKPFSVPVQEASVNDKLSEARRAAVRRGLTGGFGSYGNINSLIPGYKGGATPGEKAISNLEFNATPAQLSALASDELAPPLASFPNSSEVSQMLDRLGFEKKETNALSRIVGNISESTAGGLTMPGVGAIPAVTGAVGGTALREIGHQFNVGEGFENLLDFLGNIIATRNPGQAATKVPKTSIAQPRIVEKNIAPSKAGAITKGRLESQLERVNSEAAELTKNIGSENDVFSKISKSINEGKPIQENFNRQFNNLESIAMQQNMPLNAQNLEKFVSDEVAKFAGTGHPTEASKFITDHLAAWTSSGKNELYPMFKRYRMNNDEFSHILLTERPSPERAKKLNFLSRMNDAIESSFAHNFGGNQVVKAEQAGAKSIPNWHEAFSETNRAYTAFKNTQQAKAIIDPVLNKSLTDAKLNSFLSNERTWEDLSRFLGTQEANKLRGVLTDLKSARAGLQSMKHLDVSTPKVIATLLAAKIPGLGKLAGLVHLPTAIDWIKGMINSSPTFARNMRELTTAIVDRNLPAIQHAVQQFQEGERKEEITFIPKSHSST